MQCSFFQGLGKLPSEGRKVSGTKSKSAFHSLQLHLHNGTTHLSRSRYRYHAHFHHQQSTAGFTKFSPGKWNAGKAYGIPVDRGKSNKNGWFALPRRVVVEKSEIIKQRKLSIPSHARGRVGEEWNGMTEMLKVFKIVQSVLLCGSKYVVFDQLNSISVFRRSKNQIWRIQL